MTERVANAQEAVFGVIIDEYTGELNLGQPRPRIFPVVKPGAPSGVEGATGPISGTVLYKQSYINAKGFETDASDASAAIGPVSLKHVIVTITPSADTTVRAQRLYRSHDGGASWYRHPLGTIWDNVTTTFDDNIATDSTLIDKTLKPKTYNQTGANWEAKYFDRESAGAEPAYVYIDTKTVDGTPWPNRKIPGPVNIPFTIKAPLRVGALVPFLATRIGIPAVSGVKTGAWTSTLTDVDEPTRRYRFNPTAARRKPCSFSAPRWRGGSINPEWLWQGNVQEVDLAAAEGKAIDLSCKGSFAGHTFCGVATPTSAAYAFHAAGGVVIVRGHRLDALRGTKEVVVKIDSAPTAGVFTVKFKVDPAGSYTGGAHSAAYDTTTKRSVKHSAAYSTWTEVYDQSGIRIGGDTGELRRPFSVLFCGQVDLLEATQEWTIPTSELIPDVGTTPGTSDGVYSGFPRYEIGAPRFSLNHLTFLYGPSAADQVVDLMTATMKLTGPHKVVRQAGPDHDWLRDISVLGKLGLGITFTRRYDDRTFEDPIYQDTNFFGQLKYEGERIPVNAGVLSAQRESLVITGGGWKITDTKEPDSADETIQTVTLEVNEPDDSADETYLDIITREWWEFPDATAA